MSPFTLPTTAPYDFAALLRFFATRAIPGVESVDESSYRRQLTLTIAQQTYSDWIEVSHDAAQQSLILRIAPSLAPIAPTVVAHTDRVFDTQADPARIAATLGALASDAPGLRLPGSFDPFELTVRAVLGQQITVKAARTLAQRFVDAFGHAITTPYTEINRRFPSAADIVALDRDDIARLGIIGRRAEAIIAIARAIHQGELNVSHEADPDIAIRQLCALPGIGPWTAHYIAMRALSWANAWPPRDVALLKALGQANTAAGQREADRLAQAWQPYRSYAVLHAWRRLV
jgi:AraC family transcriptional regulator, regulatory protein of adaptative response / DNA-3-methyladenine glycosylase II